MGELLGVAAAAISPPPSFTLACHHLHSPPLIHLLPFTFSHSFMFTHPPLCLPSFVLTCILTHPHLGLYLLTLIDPHWWFLSFQHPLSFICAHHHSCCQALFAQAPPLFMLFGLCCTVTISISTLTCAYFSIFHFCCVLWVKST